jgi:subtilisin family serine protease
MTIRRSLGVFVAFLVIMLAVVGIRTHAQAQGNAAGAEKHDAGKKKQKPASKLVKHAERAIKNQYVVVFDDAVVGAPSDASQAEELADAMVATYGGRVLQKYKHALNGFSARLTDAQAAAMSQDPLVDFVEQDAQVSGTTIQGSATWGLDRVDQRPLPLNGTYSYSYTGSGISVFVIDSGIRTGHVEFGGRAAVAVDYVGDGRNGQDCAGHGTHVAGTIGGRTYGVAKSAWLYSVRVLGCDGSGPWSNVVAGVNWVTRYHRGPSVANMSLAGGAYYALDNAVTTSVNSGVTYVVAAGNSNVNACNVSPARAAGTLTIGATDGADRRVATSSWGSNYGSCVDLFAPGYNIRSASMSSTSASVLMSGTSMASPHVAGSAAVYLSAYPAATPSQVRSAIVNTATVNRLTNLAGSPNRLLFSPMHY